MTVLFFSFLASSTAARHDTVLVHPGAWYSYEDIMKVRTHVKAQHQSWYRALQHLESGYSPKRPGFQLHNPFVPVCGSNATYDSTPPANYPHDYWDAYTAYRLTFRWLIEGNTSYADHAVRILNVCGDRLRDINSVSRCESIWVSVCEWCRDSPYIPRL
jgi:hypothetical protein